jgi:hypothetical protein
MMITRRVVLSGALLVLGKAALAHGGGLNAEGCHNDRKHGGYHCHRAASARPPANASPPAQRLAADHDDAAYFANCTAARAAGAAPVRRGDAGYGRHLDRDGDGVGCE